MIIIGVVIAKNSAHTITRILTLLMSNNLHGMSLNKNLPHNIPP